MQRRHLPLLFLFFCILLIPSFAKESSERKPPAQASSEASTSYPDDDDATHDAFEDPAQNSFVEAAAILRKIKPPSTSRLAKFVRRPKGILGTTAYYAKEAFVLLFMNGPKQSTLLTTSTSSPKLSPALTKAVTLLTTAAEAGNRDATFLLAELNFYGNYSHPINYDEAFDRYRRLADLDGNSTAQYMVGFLYATGLAPSVPADQAKSMLYHTFAAMQGHTRSEMTLAYRHHAGIATPRSCEDAVRWYKRVADKAIAYYRSGPPGGHQLNRDAYRIPDEDGGVYGEGASVSSSGANAKQGGVTSDAYADVDDVLEYLHLQSSKGDLKATFGLARLHYDGARGLRRDLKLAKSYFMDVAREYWQANGKVKRDVSLGTEKLASRAAGYLGRMFLRGEGMEQASYARAYTWFRRAEASGDPLAQYSLGLMYLHGLGMEADPVKASNYFAKAADQDLPVAQTNLGMLFLDQGDMVTAAKYFQLAVRNGHIEAFYYLAEMANLAIGRDRSCGEAAVYYKIVAEKAEPVWSSLSAAVDAYDDGDLSAALIGYLMAAEQGSENSQFNVAWLLDRTRSQWSPLSAVLSALSITSSPPSPSSSMTFSDSTLALVHWTRSAAQKNVDSMLKMGDYYLAGYGLSNSSPSSPANHDGVGAPSPERAAACYQAAAESQQSAQALWNLGWMHENGVGLPQDFHLAKRLYDQALTTNREAYLPVQLSLARLRWRSWWNGVTGGAVPGIHDGGDEGETRRPRRTFSEWVRDFLEADAEYYMEHYEEDDWGQETMPGADGYWGGGGANGEGGDEMIDDGLLETLLIGGLVAALGWLIYYRQQQQRLAEQRRRQGVENGAEGQHQQQQPGDGQAARAAPPERDRGMMPNPGDPDWDNWMAGAIGP